MKPDEGLSLKNTFIPINKQKCGHFKPSISFVLSCYKACGASFREVSKIFKPTFHMVVFLKPCCWPKMDAFLIGYYKIGEGEIPKYT